MFPEVRVPAQAGTSRRIARGPRLRGDAHNWK